MISRLVLVLLIILCEIKAGLAKLTADKKHKQAAVIF
jgi:hypothetical protein